MTPEEALQQAYVVGYQDKLAQLETDIMPLMGEEVAETFRPAQDVTQKGWEQILGKLYASPGLTEQGQRPITLSRRLAALLKRVGKSPYTHGAAAASLPMLLAGMALSRKKKQKDEEED